MEENTLQNNSFISHNKVFEQVDQCGAIIRELFYIAAQCESSRFSEFIMELIDYDALESTFGFSTDIDDADEIISLLFHEQKIGFVCEIGIPKRSNFRFSEDGELEGCTVHQNSLSLYWTYAETLSELFDNVEKISEAHQDQEIQEWKSLPS